MAAKSPTRPFRSGISDLRKVLEDSFQVRHIAVAIECCDADDDAQKTRQQMQANRFDVLGYRENGEIQGYVVQNELRDGKCRKYWKRFQPAELVPCNGPLFKLLSMMKNTSRYFVQQGASVKAIVTTGDLQKAPVRMMLFGFVSLMEMYLLAMTRQCYPAEHELRKQMDQTLLQEAEVCFRKSKGKRQDVDLAECVSMTGKSRLLTRTPGFVEFFGYPDRGAAAKFFDSCVDLRNRLAHGQDLLTNTSWRSIITTAEKMERFLVKYEESAKEFEAQCGPALRC